MKKVSPRGILRGEGQEVFAPPIEYASAREGRNVRMVGREKVHQGHRLGERDPFSGSKNGKKTRLSKRGGGRDEDDASQKKEMSSRLDAKRERRKGPLCAL